MMRECLLAGVVAFSVGSIPFGFILYRLKTGEDIRERGSGNIGATNVQRMAGTGLGMATLILDCGKGFVAIAIAYMLAHRLVASPYEFLKTSAELPAYRYGCLALALVLVVAGHTFSPWLRFRGGKGVAPAMGACLALAPWAVLWSACVFAIIILLTRYVSLSSIAAGVLLPAFMWIHYGRTFPPSIYIATIGVVALVVMRHSANIQRLRRGTETRLGTKDRRPVAP